MDIHNANIHTAHTGVTVATPRFTPAAPAQAKPRANAAATIASVVRSDI